MSKVQALIALTLIALFSACSVGLVEKHLELAENYYASKQFSRAVDEYQKAINIDSDSKFSEKALRQMGRIYIYHLKDYKKAAAIFEKLIKLSKSNNTAQKTDYLELAEIYYKNLRDYSKAAKVYEQVLQSYGYSFKGSEDILFQYAQLEFDRGNYIKSGQTFFRFLELYPNHSKRARAQLLIAESWMNGGQSEKSKEAFLSFIREYDLKEGYGPFVSRAYYGLGNIFEKEDKLEDALKAYEKSKKNYPNKEVIKVKIDGVRRRRSVRKL